MKNNLHPECHLITVTCSCGNSFAVSSTLTKSLAIEICSQCHPFYTGTQKIIDSTGRVDRFKQKYATKISSKQDKLGEVH